MIDSKIAVVIPTLNEADNISELIKSMQEIISSELLSIFIVDDNSTDDTAEISRDLDAQYHNVNVHVRKDEIGIGSAVLFGLRLALSKPDIDLFVTIDADLSHNPEELPKMLSAANSIDLIQGSRYIKGGSIKGWGLRRRLISLSINMIYRILFRTGLHDHTSFFRIHSRRCAQKMVSELQCDGYELGIATILKCMDNGYSMKEIPSIFTDREGGSSKLKFRHIVKVFNYAASMFISRLRGSH